MRKSLRNRLTVIAVALILAGCSTDKTADTGDTYTCPMHPTVVSDRPATCPVCGMDLVRKARPGEEVKITGDLARLINSPNEVITTNIATVKGVYKSMNAAFITTGVVIYDERQITTIPTRIPGRLEKVYLKYAYQQVKKGQKVADIYSPDLVTVQRELIYLLENDPSNQSLIEAARRKLLLMGASENQIEDIAKKKEPVQLFPIYSAQAGFVVPSSDSAPSAPTPPASGSSAMDRMGGGARERRSSSAPKGQPLSDLMRPGRYVSAGESLFTIVNTRSVWVELKIPISESVYKDDSVELIFSNGTRQQARVNFVQPFFGEEGEFLTARIYVAGDDLQIGELVDAKVRRITGEAFWLPKSAVVDLGTDKVVFVKERETFKPKKIVVGAEVEGLVEIKEGLLSGDEVAGNGQYLVDSESFIKSK